MNDSIKINDQRRFTADGLQKNEDKPQDSYVNGAPTSASIQTDLPDIDFSTFILSLASSVQICLGVVPHPLTQKTQVDLENAKQTINILGLLEQKTKNNLTSDESGLLQQILYGLRLQYVEISKDNQKTP